MSMVTALGRAIQQTFGEAVAQAALASQVIQRKLTAAAPAPSNSSTTLTSWTTSYT